MPIDESRRACSPAWAFLKAGREAARSSFWLALLAFLLSAATVVSAAATATGPEVEAEIGHLLNYLAASGCEFYRNGSWHGAEEARAHLEKKRSYLASRSLIHGAEDFIERAATASSISGEKYLVRCAPADAVPSADWLTAELKRFRAAGRKQTKAAGP